MSFIEVRLIIHSTKTPFRLLRLFLRELLDKTKISIFGFVGIEAAC